MDPLDELSGHQGEDALGLGDHGADCARGHTGSKCAEYAGGISGTSLAADAQRDQMLIDRRPEVVRKMLAELRAETVREREDELALAM
jgi:hypothetical protein